MFDRAVVFPENRENGIGFVLKSTEFAALSTRAPTSSICKNVNSFMGYYYNFWRIR